MFHSINRVLMGLALSVHRLLNIFFCTVVGDTLSFYSLRCEKKQFHYRQDRDKRKYGQFFLKAFRAKSPTGSLNEVLFFNNSLFFTTPYKMQPVRIQKHRCIFQPSHRCLLSFDRLHFETSVISGLFSAFNLDNLKIC